MVDPVDGRARDIRSGKEPSKEEAWALKDYWEYEYYQEKKEQERVRDLEEKMRKEYEHKFLLLKK